MNLLLLVGIGILAIGGYYAVQIYRERTDPAFRQQTLTDLGNRLATTAQYTKRRY